MKLAASILAFGLVLSIASAQASGSDDPQLQTMQRQYQAEQGGAPPGSVLPADYEITGAPQLLFDQTASQTISGALSIYDLDGPAIWAVQSADDFIVPAGEAWELSRVIAYGFYGGLVNPATEVRVYIYENDGDLPGDELISFIDIAPADDDDGILTFDLPQTVSLTEGRYWLSVQPVMDFFGDGRWFWSQISDEVGNEFHWRNPGNGYGSGCTDWSPASDCGFGNPNLSFQLFGFIPEPELQISPVVLDFGDQLLGSSSAPASITLENTGTADAEISSVTAASAPFAVVGGSCGTAPFTLTVGSACTLDFVFTPTAIGAASQNIIVASNAPSSPDSIELVGNGIPDSFTIGGVVSGLEGSGLELTLNDDEVLSISADGGFVFVGALPDGSSYAVTVTSQPTDPMQTCSVTNGEGTVAGENVTNVMVSCATESFSIGGAVSGLQGSGLELTLNDDEVLPISSDGLFVFSTELVDLSNYSVIVLAQPGGQHCTVENGSGTLAGADVDDVMVSCANLVLGLSLDNIQFGALAPGQFDEQAVTLTNTGPADLVIEQFMLPEAPFGFDPGDCGPLPLTLIPGQFCTLTLSFEPTGQGDFDDQLLVVSNAANSPHSVGLAGSSMRPPIPVPAVGPLALLLMMLAMLMAGMAGASQGRLFGTGGESSR
ncbi:MAG: choice-of-anchor D domain-containing protein [Wenzhouxiangellaceae bacterium]|nr:MAG: choice-of-anchor D domain-containing protein [Wenzhouxiangellaceae bacterium]